MAELTFDITATIAPAVHGALAELSKHATAAAEANRQLQEVVAALCDLLPVPVEEEDEL